MSILIDMKRGRAVDLLLGSILLVVYFVSAILGLKIHAASGFATLVWVPTGLSLAFVYLKGLRFWPAIFLGALAANIYTGAPTLAAIGIGIGNTLEAVVGVYLLRRLVKFEPQLNRIKDVLGLIFFAALISTLISATIGVTCLWLASTVESYKYPITWFAWWSGDAISDLVIAPLIFVWSVRLKPVLKPAYILEISMLLFTFVVVSEIVFGILAAGVSSGRPRTYFIFLPLVWAAIRFSPRVTVTSIFIISSIATWNTVHSTGIFSNSTPINNLINLQTYTAVVASTAMILAAAISERKLYEQKKDEFISVASHELKTPITSIKMFTQTLQILFERQGDRRSSDLMKRANRQLDKLNQLVVKLLDMSRIQEGRTVLQKEKFNICELAQETVTEISATSDNKFKVRGAKNVFIIADRDKLGRVLTNLLTNAVKYSPARSRIIVEITKKSGQLVVSVQDFGRGLSKKEQANIFDRFYRAGQPTSKDDFSLGLGLYIAKEIIELHKGKIWVQSQPGSKKGLAGGSTFYFALPLRDVKE